MPPPVVSTNENEELLDLVDANDVVVGTIRRGDMVKAGYAHEQGHVRFVNAFILNNEGKIWVPIRGMHKSIAPGGRDFSVAEHVASGESYEDAILRGFIEEAGLHLTKQDLTLISKLPPSDGDPGFKAIYTYTMPDDTDPEYSHEEFSSASWMTLEDFEKALTSGSPTKSALLPTFRLLQATLSRDA